MNRREALKISGISGLALPLTSLAMDKDTNQTSTKVHFIRDGLDLRPGAYSKLLSRLSNDYKSISDSYSKGGIVEALEEKFASMLGKESAVFMPTGTLANQIALRKHCIHQHRAIVQMESHIYNDAGDCSQTLNNVNLIPIGQNQATFTLNDVKEVVKRTQDGRVQTGVGAIMIESPVRRVDNALFDFDEMQKISHYAKSNNIKMHLDGARLFNAVAHTGIPANKFAALFDTVYISLYKDFNAASGAILAGSREFCEELYHTRRMFGGGLPQAWPFALVAYHYSDRFLPDYTKAMKHFERFRSLLMKDERFEITTIPNGTNVFLLALKSGNIEKFRTNLAAQNIYLPSGYTHHSIKIKLNVTINQMSVNDLVRSFQKAISS